MELITTNGVFSVRIRAALPHIEVTVPPRLDFGFVPAKEVGRKSFPMTNTGEIEVPFRWKIAAPFHFEPAEGSLAPGETITIHATFTPDDASVFTVSALGVLDADHSVPPLSLPSRPYLACAKPAAVAPVALCPVLGSAP